MSKEVMKLALSTLEGWANYDDWVWPESALEQAKRNTIEAITALRQALETDKQWVGLTDEEVSYFEYQATFCDELDTALMAELIEQALKKKNNGRYRNRTTTERTKLKEKSHG
jgi:hypothetical protein